MQSVIDNMSITIKFFCLLCHMQAISGPVLVYHQQQTGSTSWQGFSVMREREKDGRETERQRERDRERENVWCDMEEV